MQDPVYRASQLKNNCTDETCLKIGELSQQKHHSVATLAVRESFCSSHNETPAKDTTVTRHRDDYQEAVVKFREAPKAAVAKGEVETRSTP